MATIGSEVEVLTRLGIPNWRHLTKDGFLQFLEDLPDVDTELARSLIAQVPEITKLARSVLADAAKAYDGALAASSRGLEMVHEIDVKHLEALKAELDREGLSPEERRYVLDEMREINTNAHLKDTENKRWLSEQFEKRLIAGAMAGATILAVVFAATRSGHKPSFGAVRLLKGVAATSSRR